MSARRAIDLITLFKASKSVTEKHLSLRRQQFELYGKTSSLVKGLELQSSQVTRIVIVAAASLQSNDSRKRSFYEPPQRSKDSSDPSKGKAESHSEEQLRQVIDQDSYDKRSEQNLDKEPLPQKDSNLATEAPQNNPPLEETVLSSKSSVLRANRSDDSSLEVANPCASEESTKHESQSIPQSSGGSRISAPKWTAERIRDSQNADGPTVPMNITEEPSKSNGLDRISTARLETQQANIDTDNASPQEVSALPVSQAIPQQEQLSDDTLSKLFRSPKVSRVIQNSAKQNSSWDSIRLQRADVATSYLSTQAGENGQRNPDDGSGKLNLKVTKAEKTHGEQASSFVAEVASDPNQDTDLMQSHPSAQQMHESSVPSSRLGRMWHYSGLATSMAFGAVGESLRRVTGSQSASNGSLMLGGRNMDRLVTKLSRMRGAALKLGQIISFQGS